MSKCDVNKRHQSFKRELRAYHDSINRRNRYNLARIAGKLNVFESDEDKDDADVSYTVDRKIPNTGLTVLERNGIYAIGNIDGIPLTEFKYQFIEGCLGEHDKIVRCVTDDGEMEDFSVESETILEDASACTGMSVSMDASSNGFGLNDLNGGCEKKDYTEIDYSDVKQQLTIPYLCGARVVDIQNGRAVHNRKRKKRRNNS